MEINELRRGTRFYTARTIQSACHVFSVVDTEIAGKRHLWTENRLAPDLRGYTTGTYILV